MTANVVEDAIPERVESRVHLGKLLERVVCRHTECDGRCEMGSSRIRKAWKVKQPDLGCQQGSNPFARGCYRVSGRASLTSAIHQKLCSYPIVWSDCRSWRLCPRDWPENGD